MTLPFIIGIILGSWDGSAVHARWCNGSCGRPVPQHKAQHTADRRVRVAGWMGFWTRLSEEMSAKVGVIQWMGFILGRTIMHRFRNFIKLARPPGSY